MPYVYILECCDGSFHVGSTVQELDARVAQHNAKQGSAYTRRRTPLRLLWAQEFDRVDEAFFREKQIQGWGRAKRQALIDGRLEHLPGLSRSKRAEREETARTSPRLGKLDDRKGWPV